MQESIFPYHIRNEENLRRLFMEAIDVAFILSNKLDTFKPSKIIDIIDQLIPTAVILNTCYWPFYSRNGDSLCVCQQFGISCPHVKMLDQHINVEQKSEPGDLQFLATTQFEKTVPRNVNIDIHFDEKLNLIKVFLKFHIMRVDSDHIYFSGKIHCCMSYELKPQKFCTHQTILLVPHPQRLYFYGKYQRYDVSGREIPDLYMTDGCTMPPYTLKLKDMWQSVSQSLNLEDVKDLADEKMYKDLVAPDCPTLQV